jgi:hypothetical protein
LRRRSPDRLPQLRLQLVRLVGHTDAFEDLASDSRFRLARRHARGLDLPEGDVLPDCLVGEEVERLEHHPDVGA